MSEHDLLFPSHWREAALDAPRVYAEPCGTALLRQQPEDFQVDECLGFEPSGAGSHIMLHIEKRDANTMWVAKQIAAEARVRVQDVGFAGLKDRHALTRQWFSVPARGRSAASWEGFSREGFFVCAAALHNRKLPRGALKGNRFRIVLRDVQGAKEIFESRLSKMSQVGIANYFGPQRFGHEAGNLQALATTVHHESTAGEAGESDRRHATGERPSGWLISTARSLMFNAVLAERVRRETWCTLSAGERANLDGSNSSFIVETVDDTIQERLSRLDIHPTGPLPGIGSKVLFTGEIAEMESAVLSQFDDIHAWLQRVGVEAARRPLRARVDELRYAWLDDGSSLELQFYLRAGSFATALLRELIAFDQILPEGAE